MPPQTQTADEILENYFENTERLDAWKSIQGMKMTAKVHQGEMEIPLEFYNLKYSRQITKITFQGNTIKQGVFDGETLSCHYFSNRVDFLRRMGFEVYYGVATRIDLLESAGIGQSDMLISAIGNPDTRLGLVELV